MLDGRLSGLPDMEIAEVMTDSRRLGYGEGLAFLAISGKNHDGHNYIDSMYQKGVRVFIVERLPVNIEGLPDSAFIIVDNSIEALQKLASHVREDFASPVIAVTGSAGKTVVKEWLADVLGLTQSVIRSPKSYNSQVGVPLSVMRLDSRYRLAVFEAGISMPGEMNKLQKILKPDIGVITNIGDAHRENFPDDRTKTTEKLILFKDVSMIIYSSDQEIVHSLILDDPVFSNKKLVDWSFGNKNAAAYVRKEPSYGGITPVTISYEGKVHSFDIPFSDRASVENAVTVAVTCLAIGIRPDILGKGLSSLESVAMRMELKNGINNCQLIEDYYNSDPGSLGMALEYLRSQKGLRTTLILSDFIQSGREEKELYSDVAGFVMRSGINKFIGIGNALTRNSNFFKLDSSFYGSTDEFIRNVNISDYRNEIILIKGARIYEFEKIGSLLEQQIHQTVLEINLDALAHNLNEFRRNLNPGTRIMAMVKAFAYGAGSAEIAKFLEYHRVSYLGVAYADEGVELRNSGITLPIMVMNPDPSAAEVMIRYSLEPEIYSFSSLEKFVSVASRHGVIDYPVHIKIDTGMHRLGFVAEDATSLTEMIRRNESIRVISVFSHLAASEDPSLDNFTLKQVETFLAVARQVEKAAGHPLMRHILNSAGIARFPQYQFEMVRPGIGLYGVGKYSGLKMKPTGRFITSISQVKLVRKGEPVGYGCVDVSENDRLIATLPVGYADGLNRRLGNGKGCLYIKGRRVSVTGNICMDMCMADVSGIDAHEGDEAEIFGDNISIEEIAEKCDTIPYEVLTSIPGRVKRVFFRD